VIIQRAIAALLLGLSSVTNTIPIPQEYRGNAMIMLTTGDQNMVNRMCGKASPGFVTIGCGFQASHQVWGPNPCDYPEEKDLQSYAHFLCHEKAHILGWHHRDE
jgi:hypothetical protein